MKNDNEVETKKRLVCHAELNAIVNAFKDLKGCTMYATLHPCNECAKLIIQSGITEVFYLSDKYKNKPEFKAGKKLFENCSIPCSQFIPDGDGKIFVNFTEASSSS